MQDNTLKGQYFQQPFTQDGIFGPFDISTKDAATIEADFHAGSGTVVIRKTNLPKQTNVQELDGTVVATLANGGGQAFKSSAVLSQGECFMMCFADVTVVSGSIGLRFLSQPNSI
jgi:hypothetical protein